MSLVEALRARKTLLILAIILVLSVLGNAFAASWGIHNAVVTQHIQQNAKHEQSSSFHVTIGGDSGDTKDDDFAALAGKNFGVPLGILFGVSSLVAILFATIVGTSLNKENCLGGFAFTKPISRERLALTYFAVDAGGMIAAFLMQLIISFVALAIVGILGRVFVDSTAPYILVLGLGVAVMWYGMLQAITSGLRFGGGMFIGIGWGVCFFLLALHGVTALGPAFHALITGLNFLNPLAYFTSFGITGENVTTTSLNVISDPFRVIIPWTIGIVGCAIAIFSWKRVEV
jgi:hypothetical protein